MLEQDPGSRIFSGPDLGFWDPTTPCCYLFIFISIYGKLLIWTRITKTNRLTEGLCCYRQLLTASWRIRLCVKVTGWHVVCHIYVPFLIRQQDKSIQGNRKNITHWWSETEESRFQSVCVFMKILRECLCQLTAVFPQDLREHTMHSGSL